MEKGRWKNASSFFKKRIWNIVKILRKQNKKLYKRYEFYFLFL